MAGLKAGGYILAEAGLSFLGLGAQLLQPPGVHDQFKQGIYQFGAMDGFYFRAS